jgi:hypothetical protein
VSSHFRLLQHNRVRRGSVRLGVINGLSNSGVTLTSGERFEDDIIVVATGSHYASPFKPQGESTEAFVEGVRAAYSTLKSANAIAIIGGGSVGLRSRRGRGRQGHAIYVNKRKYCFVMPVGASLFGWALPNQASCIHCEEGLSFKCLR